jgi:DNA polymerase-1
MGAMKTLYLIDGMALAYRSHFALIRSPIYTSKGFNTSAIYGFTAALIELLTHRKPSHLAIVFDTDAPTERHRLHPEYKAHREAMPEDLAAALPHLSRIAEAFDIPVLTKDGYEADDIIATLAKQAAAQDFEVFMVTPDKDFGQLVTDRVLMYRPSRQGDGAEILDVDAVKAKWGIARVEQVIDMLGLCGDASDNIPGIPGVGPKTAQKLLAEYDNVENLIANADALKGKLRERVKEHAEQALVSKRLATIDQAVPVEVDWDQFKVHPPEPEKLLPLFAEFEFRTLRKRIFGDDAETDFALESADGIRSDGRPGQSKKASESVAVQAELLPFSDCEGLDQLAHNYKTVSGLDDLQQVVSTLSEREGFAFDTETTQLNPHRAEWVGLALARLDKREGWWIPLPPRDSDERAAFIKVLEPLFANQALEKVGHNLKFDLAILQLNGLAVEGPLYDTLLAHSLVAPTLRHGLDRLAEECLHYRTIPFSALGVESDADGNLDYRNVEPALLRDYAVEDADVAGRLRAHLEPQIDALEQRKVFRDIECRLLPALTAMEVRGIRLDPLALESCGSGMADKIVALEEACFDYAGRPFNLNSPKQLGEVLFDEMAIAEKPKKTKTGQYATNEQVLSTLVNRHPIIPAILEHRGLVKLKNTYIDTLPFAIEPKTGRIHTHFGQVQTSTGRLSSNNPNLQNIPVRSGEGREIRRAFVPQEGWIMISADYSQIELRILAALSGDEGLLHAFAEGRDIHTATAARIYGVELEAVDRSMRSKAKMVNFGIPYGISAFGLAQRLAVSRTEAQELISHYFEQFPGVLHYTRETIEFARQHGYVETLSGRRRSLEDIHSANATIRSSAERNAINMPIQGTAADMIKLAMIRVYERLKAEKLSTALLLQVHDELILEAPPSEVEHVCELTRTEMREALPMTCPIEVEVGVGPNWLEAH